MKLPRLIGICGATGAGKTTLGTYITRRAARAQVGLFVLDCIGAEDEAEHLRKAGGVVIRVRRPGYPEPPAVAAIAATYTLHNDADLYALALRIDSLIHTMSTVEAVPLEP